MKVFKPKREAWFCWKEFKIVGTEKKPRLTTPWSDPYKYEYAADELFTSKRKARSWKRNIAPEEDWVLIKLIMKPVRRK
jgi:hypothetical protein